MHIYPRNCCKFTFHLAIALRREGTKYGLRMTKWQNGQTDKWPNGEMAAMKKQQTDYNFQLTLWAILFGH